MQKQATFSFKVAKNATRKNAMNEKKNLSMEQSQGTTGIVTMLLSGLSSNAVRGLRHRGSDTGITNKQAIKYQPSHDDERDKMLLLMNARMKNGGTNASYCYQTARAANRSEKGTGWGEGIKYR